MFEDGGWRVSYAGTRIQPLYPSDVDASSAVRAWVDVYQRCVLPGPDLEYASGVAGVPALTAQLCRAPGDIEVAAAKPLGDRPDPSSAIAAFGPAADSWARVVHVKKPIALNVVAAPLGDHWIVIGVLADRS